MLADFELVSGYLSRFEWLCGCAADDGLGFGSHGWMDSWFYSL